MASPLHYLDLTCLFAPPSYVGRWTNWKLIAFAWCEPEEGNMIIEHLGFVAPPDQRADLYKTLYSSLGPTRVKPGCVGCNLYEDSDAKTYHLESRWETTEDLIRHIRSDAYKRLLLLMELGADAPSIEFFTVSEIRGLEFIEAARNGMSNRNVCS